MSGLNLEQTGRSVEETLKSVGFDPAELLRRRREQSKPPSPSTSPGPITVGTSTSPPSVAAPPATEVAPGVLRFERNAIAQSEAPAPLRRELFVGQPRQIQVKIPENVADLQGWVEGYVRDQLGVKAPVSSAAASSAPNPASVAISALDADDDAALAAELEAWFSWKVGGGGPEPILPVEWKPVLERTFSVANIASLTFEVVNGRLIIHGLSEEERRAIYNPETPAGEITIPEGIPSGNLPAPVDLSTFNPNLGGSPMTMVVPGAAGVAAAGARSLWGLVKSYGVPAVIAWLTAEYVGQGLDENAARQQAEMAVSQARPPGRRRRRRLLTCQDKEDIQFLRATLGGGELGKSAITALLAGCRR